jgi:putative transposase
LLNNRGYDCSENLAANLMSAHGIVAKTTRRCVRTTDSRQGLAVADNLLGRDFDPDGPNVASGAEGLTCRRRTTTLSP